MPAAMRLTDLFQRNYHIFYEMLVGLPDAMRKKMMLTTAESFLYLNQGKVVSIPAKDDVDDFNKTSRAMEVLGFKPQEQESIFRVLAAIMHLGNVSFGSEVKDNVDVANIQAKHVLSIAAGLLGVAATDLAEQLVTKSQITRGEKIVSPLNITQALDTRDALDVLNARDVPDQRDGRTCAAAAPSLPPPPPRASPASAAARSATWAGAT